MDEESVADREAVVSAVTFESLLMDASTVFSMTLPKPVMFSATLPATPTPAVRAMMPDELDASRATLPALEVTPASLISACTVLVMTLPVSAPLAATPPPATLTLTARMLASRSIGESARLALRSA